MPIYFILESRFLLATLLLYAYAKLKKTPCHFKEIHLDRFHWFMFIIQALCAGFLFNLFLLNGLNHTSASSAGIITSFLPSMVVILSVIFLRETMAANKIFSLIIATLGLILVNVHTGTNSHIHPAFFGNLLIFISLFPEAFFYVLAKKVQYPISHLATAIYMNAINALFFLPFAFMSFNLLDIHVLNSQILLLNGLLGLTTGLFYLFWYVGAEKVEASVASLFTAVMPIGTLLIARVTLNEKLTSFEILGMILIISAIIIASKTKTQSFIKKSTSSSRNELI